MSNSEIERYWQTYLQTLPPNSPTRHKSYVAEPFGDSSALADELGLLIVSGAKTATCSALWEWEVEGDPIPEPGAITIVLNGSNEPLCIIETTEVTVQPYQAVDARFAYEEGEGDRSLEYWRQEHWRYFSRVLPKIGKEPAPDMPLVCERFRVISR